MSKNKGLEEEEEFGFEDENPEYNENKNKFNAEYIRTILLDSDPDAGGYLMVKKPLIHALGLNEAIIYCELINKWYWYENNTSKKHRDFFCTIDDLEVSTGLSQTAQKTAVKNLIDFQLINVVIRGMPSKRYYEILNTINPDNEDEHIILKYIAIGLKIIELKKERSMIRSQYRNNKSDELKLDLEEINKNIKNIKVT